MAMLDLSPLGRTTASPSAYSPNILCPIARHLGRTAHGLEPAVVSAGVDWWTAYELSWLGPQGVPQVAIMQLCVPACSAYIVESKSLKLYLHSLTNARFASAQAVTQTVAGDLSHVTQARWNISILQGQGPHMLPQALAGHCIDQMPLVNPSFVRNPDFLVTQARWAEETLYSDLLKSNCPVTGQPDWASIQIKYRGPQLNQAGLLRYILSYRNHTGFHELCVEQIYSDILRLCQPQQLSVYARYTRRGGLDINPFRSNFEAAPDNVRTYRQ